MNFTQEYFKLHSNANFDPNKISRSVIPPYTYTIYIGVQQEDQETGLLIKNYKKRAIRVGIN